MVETVLKVPCPICNHDTMKYSTEILNLPYFDEVLNTTISCDNCDYKYNDILVTSQNQPMEHKFKITKKDDLNVRVVRSSSATVELPELGVKIEPASASEAFITNIEGVLVRVCSAIEYAKNFAEGNDEKKHAQKLLKRIKELQAGVGTVTIIIKNPMGNSGILSDKTEIRELTTEEISILETGMTIIDITE